MMLSKTHLLRHPREGGDPLVFLVDFSKGKMDSRLRGNDGVGFFKN